MPHSVRQNKICCPFHIGRNQIVPRRQRGDRPGSFQQKKLGPMPGRIGLGAVLRRQLHHRRVNRNLAQQFTGRQTTLFQQPGFFTVLRGKTGSIAFPGKNPPHHLDSCRGIRFPLHSRKQAKPVQHRRSQRCFFRIHRSDQCKPYRMLMGNSFPFHGIDAPIHHCQNSGQHFPPQQINLVHIQNLLMRPRQQPWRKHFLAAGQRLLQIDIAKHLILARIQRQFDKPLSWSQLRKRSHQH